MRAWAGIDGEAADKIPVIGRSLVHEGLTHAFGFSGHGFQLVPAVGRASGAIILTAAQAGLPVFEYTPSAVKMAVCGVGDADKEQVQAVVAMRLGLDAAPKPADAADALAIALCHLQSAPLRRAVEAAR